MKITITPQYCRLYNIEDEAMMGLVFNYYTPLCQKLFKYANSPMEMGSMLNLFNSPYLNLKLENNGNLTFYEKRLYKFD